MDLSEEELRDLLQSNDDYTRYQWIDHRIQECVEELNGLLISCVSYQEDFNIYDNTDLRSELSLGIAHLIKVCLYASDYLDGIEDDIKAQHFLDNYDPTEEEIESMIKPRK